MIFFETVYFIIGVPLSAQLLLEVYDNHTKFLYHQKGQGSVHLVDVLLDALS